ncbi:unnamed protein product [Trichobilharzia szidati]|nr:unnamed protein product [Trichobilharzia szidati]
MERFYPNFYSYTKSHYEPLVSSLLTRSEPERSAKLHIDCKDNDASEEKQNSSCSERQNTNMNEVTEQQNSSASSNMLRQRIQSVDRTKMSRNQLAKWTTTDSQRWARENSDPPGREKSTEEEDLTGSVFTGSVQSFILPFTRINEYLTLGINAKYHNHSRTFESGINYLSLVSRNDVRCNIIPNCQHFPDLMSTSLTKTNSPIKHKSRSLRKHSREKTLPCSNQDDKTLMTLDSNNVFINLNESKLQIATNQKSVPRSRRLPSPCVRMKTLETDTNYNVSLETGQNTSSSNYDLRPKRLIETERMVRQELASAKQKSATFNSNNGIDREDRKSAMQNSPIPLKKSSSSERRQIISPDTNTPVNVLEEINSFEMSDSETDLSRGLERTRVLRNGDDLIRTDGNSKNSEIQELQGIINHIREEDRDNKSLANSPNSFKPSPRRSMSCRTLPDAMYQDNQDAVSLSSVASDTSAGSQTISVDSKKHDNYSHSVGNNTSTLEKHGVYTKHSRWLGKSIAKAFRRRTRSTTQSINSLGTINDTTITNMEPNQIISQKSNDENQLDRLYLTISRLQCRIDLLEKRNKKLQETVSKYNPDDELLCNEFRLERTNRKVFLSDLSSKFCKNSRYFVPVLVNTEEIIIDSETKKSLKIGCIGLHDDMTWNELDEVLQKLLQCYISYLDPSEHLQLNSLELGAYQLNSIYKYPDIKKTESIVRRFSRILPLPSPQPLFTTNQNHSQLHVAATLETSCHINRQIYSQFPVMWLNEITKGYDLELFTLSIEIDLQGRTMNSTLKRKNKKVHQNVTEKIDMLNYGCYTSLVPYNTLKSYLSVIEANNFTIICGLTGTGKSHLVNNLAKILSHDSCYSKAIYNFRFTNNKSPTVKEMKKILRKQLSSFSKCGFPKVINLFDMHLFQGSVMDIFNVFNTSSKRPKIIGTSERADKDFENTCHDNHVKIIHHLPDIKSTQEYLESVLYRNLAQSRMFCSGGLTNEDVNTSANKDRKCYQLIFWLTEFWRKLNEILCSIANRKHCAIFGVQSTLKCPMDINDSLHWFLDLWNNMLVPVLFENIRYVTKEKSNNDYNMLLTDFIAWTSTTWPWDRSKIYFPTSLKSPKISLTQNPSSTQSIQPMQTPCSSLDAEVCKNRTSMDSGIILDGMYPTNACSSNDVEQIPSNTNDYIHVIRTLCRLELE